MPTLSDPLTGFEQNLRSLPDPVASLKAGLIGGGTDILTPEGPKPLIYADYVASGRALVQIEEFITRNVLPYYANSHTEDDISGRSMTRLLHEAETSIKRSVNAGEDGRIIACGSGATGAIDSDRWAGNASPS